MNIAVYCASSSAIDDKYFAAAGTTGRLLAERGHTLVYGGGSVGLMGAVARAVHASGGHVVGIIPEALKSREGVAYDAADELIITETMQERKRRIYTRAHAFLMLPGGFGTLEEFMEVFTLRRLGYHDHPIALLDVDGFYEPLMALFDHYYATGFAAPDEPPLFHRAATPREALTSLEREEPIAR